MRLDEHTAEVFEDAIRRQYWAEVGGARRALLAACVVCGTGQHAEGKRCALSPNPV